MSSSPGSRRPLRPLRSGARPPGPTGVGDVVPGTVAPGAVALVTGATAGIGRAFATALAGRGCDLVLVARDGARLEDLAARLRGQGVAVQVLVADLSVREELERVAERIRDPQAPPVALLLNNAGFAVREPVPASDVAAEEAMLDVLVRAVLVLSHAAAGVMTGRGRGTVVNVSSVASFLTGGTYAAAKAWVTSFTAGLDVELAGTGVRACALCPGYVRTEFHQRMGSSPDRIAPSWAWLDADRLVADCLDDVARGATFSVPSRRYSTAVALLRALPLRAAPAVGRVVAARRRR